MRALRLATIGLAALLSTPAVAQIGAPPRYESAPCGFEGVAADWPALNSITCGWVSVPESRGRAGSRQLRLRVVIARATATQRRSDPILYLHGGPGIATVDSWFPFFPNSVAWPRFRGRDIIFFDQRGTGASQPAFCTDLNRRMDAIDSQGLAPEPELAAQLEAISDCRRELAAQGADLSAYSSREIAADAEDLRLALGHQQWNVYGTSFGTLVALEMIRRHPGTVRSAILDSPFPPNSAFWAEQHSAMAGALEAIERACAAQAACRQRFPALRDRFAEAVARLNANPIARDGGRITGDTFVSTIWTLMVQGPTVRFAPIAIDRAAAGDDQAVRRLVAAFGGANRFGAYSWGQALAVNCHDVFGRGTAPSVRSALRRYPWLAGAGEIPESQDRLCAAMQPFAAPPDHHAPVASDVPVLIYVGEFDPATPPADGYHAARPPSRATILAVPGASHAPFYTDECTRGLALAFLEQPAAPLNTDCLAQVTVAPFELNSLDPLFSD